MQELADGVAIHGSVAPSVLEEAARQYVSKVEAYSRKTTPTKRKSGGPDSQEEIISLLRGISARLHFFIRQFCETVSVFSNP